MILSTTTHWRDWSTSASTPFADAVLCWSLWYCATAANRPKRQGSYWTHRAPPLLCLCVCGLPPFFSCLPFFFFIVFFLFFFLLLLLLPHQKRTNQRLYRSCAASFFLLSQNSDNNNNNIFVLPASSSSSICYLLSLSSSLHSCCLLPANLSCKSVLGVILQSWKWFVCLFVILLLVFAPRLPFWFWLARCPLFGGLL